MKASAFLGIVLLFISGCANHLDHHVEYSMELLAFSVDRVGPYYWGRTPTGYYSSLEGKGILNDYMKQRMEYEAAFGVDAETLTKCYVLAGKWRIVDQQKAVFTLIFFKKGGERIAFRAEKEKIRQIIELLPANVRYRLQTMYETSIP